MIMKKWYLNKTAGTTTAAATVTAKTIIRRPPPTTHMPHIGYTKLVSLFVLDIV